MTYDNTPSRNETCVTGPLFDGRPCIACPIEVRDLSASAANAWHAIDAALNGQGGWERARRKLADLKASLDRFQPFVDAHFADRRHSHAERS